MVYIVALFQHLLEYGPNLWTVHVGYFPLADMKYVWGKWEVVVVEESWNRTCILLFYVGISILGNNLLYPIFWIE